MTQEKVINPFRNFKFEFDTFEKPAFVGSEHVFYLDVTHPEFPHFKFQTQAKLSDKAVREDAQKVGTLIATMFERTLRDLTLLMLHGLTSNEIEGGAGILDAGIAYNKEKQLWYSTKTIYEKN